MQASLQSTEKQRLKQLSYNIERLVYVLRVDLSRLKSHHRNLKDAIHPHKTSHHHQTSFLMDVRAEVVNSGRTLKQLENRLCQINHLRQMCHEDDLRAFDLEMEPISEEVTQGIAQFRDLYRQSVALHSHSEELSPHDKQDSFPSQSSSSSESSSQLQESLPMQRLGVVADELAEQRAMEQCWRELADNVEHAQIVVQRMHQLIIHHTPALNAIEANVDTAATNVEQAKNNLASAVRWKTALLPVGGAVLGCVVAGPVGFAIGAKIGACVGIVGGGVLGATSGTLLKKSHQPSS